MYVIDLHWHNFCIFNDLIILNIYIYNYIEPKALLISKIFKVFKKNYYLLMIAMACGMKNIIV